MLLSQCLEQFVNLPLKFTLDMSMPSHIIIYTELASLKLARGSFLKGPSNIMGQ